MLDEAATGEGGGPRLLRGLRWEDFADGRVHRLKRHKHFAGPVRAVQQECDAAATTLGRGVLVVREEFGRQYQYLWVQFTDQRLAVGQPCRCGGLSQTRLHLKFGRCDACGATIAYRGTYDVGVADVGSDPVAQSPRRGSKHLSDYTEVEFVARDPERSTPEEDVWFARAVDAGGGRVFLVVHFPLERGHRIADAGAPGYDAHVAFKWRIDPYIRAIELGVLDVWDDVPGAGRNREGSQAAGGDIDPGRP